jgi:tRNA pseudouridine38-40 synthase
MAVYRIDLAYDGTGFRGWARNAGVRTVQGEIESALATVLREEVALSVAGRTDAGVHARHQVASFATAPGLDVVAVLRSLRTMLASEIAVHDLHVAPDGFDARFSAIGRSYRYFIDEAAFHDPRQACWVWHLAEALDLDAMNRAAAALVGAHDFASLCRAADGGTTERTVDDAGWGREGTRHQAPGTREEVDSQEVASHQSPVTSGLLVFVVSAKAFCHQMVRSMVALCVDVGRGRIRAEAVPGILERKDRNAARGVAPPHGLVLWDVEY